MQECQARTALKKLGHMGTDIKRVMPGLPSLKGSAGYLKLLGRLALGYPLRLKVKILFEHIGPFEAVPELVTVDMIMGCKIDDSVHCYLALQSIV